MGKGILIRVCLGHRNVQRHAWLYINKKCKLRLGGNDNDIKVEKAANISCAINVIIQNNIKNVALPNKKSAENKRKICNINSVKLSYSN